MTTQTEINGIEVCVVDIPKGYKPIRIDHNVDPDEDEFSTLMLESSDEKNRDTIHFYELPPGNWEIDKGVLSNIGHDPETSVVLIKIKDNG